MAPLALLFILLAVSSVHCQELALSDTPGYQVQEAQEESVLPTSHQKTRRKQKSVADYSVTPTSHQDTRWKQKSVADFSVTPTSQQDTRRKQKSVVDFSVTPTSHQDTRRKQKSVADFSVTPTSHQDTRRKQKSVADFSDTPTSHQETRRKQKSVADFSVTPTSHQETRRKQKSVADYTSYRVSAGVENSPAPVFTNSHSFSTTERLPYTHKPTALPDIYKHVEEENLSPNKHFDIGNPSAFFSVLAMSNNQNYDPNVIYLVPSNSQSFGADNGLNHDQRPSDFNLNRNLHHNSPNDGGDGGNYLYSNTPYIDRGSAFDNEVVPKFYPDERIPIKMPYLVQHQPVLHHIVHSIRNPSPLTDHFVRFPIERFDKFHASQNFIPDFPPPNPYFSFD